MTTAARAAAAKLGNDTVVLDVHEVLAITDAFVITSGRNRRQVLTIAEEVEALRELLPKGLFFVGNEARVDKLRRYGPTAGKLHIAAHGIFRPDNPMFSSIKLGESWFNLFDIFNLQLGAELTVLSACETGMSAVWEGDELLGLARGFFYAGTPALVVSLWTVNDRSTAQFMCRFYAGLQDGLSNSRALRQAVIEVKASFAHPYYWAPFILMGKS